MRTPALLPSLVAWFLLATGRLPAATIGLPLGERPFGDWTFIAAWSEVYGTNQMQTSFIQVPGRSGVVFRCDQPFTAHDSFASGVKFASSAPLLQGRRYRLGFEWRSVGHLADLTIAFGCTAGAGQIWWGYQVATVPTNWAKFHFTFPALQALPPERLSIALFVGAKPMTLELAAITGPNEAIGESRPGEPQAESVDPNPAAPTAVTAEGDKFPIGSGGFSSLLQRWPLDPQILTIEDRAVVTKAANPLAWVATVSKATARDYEAGVALPIVIDLTASRRYRFVWPMRSRVGQASVGLSLGTVKPPFANRWDRQVMLLPKWEDQGVIMVPDATIPAHQVKINLNLGAKKQTVELGRPTIAPVRPGDKGEVVQIKAF